MNLIAKRTLPQLWLAATEHLLNCDGADFDVFLNAVEPTVYETGDREVVAHVDNFFKATGGLRLETVAETIFPMSYYRRNGTAGLFEQYPAAMQKIRGVRASDRAWGTYALRLVSPRTDGKNRTYVPLQATVAKIKAQRRYVATHELNLGPIEEDIDIYQPDTDRNRPYGGPCLSHLSFKVDDGQIRLNATYRSHFYIQRLLGNLLGLTYLQIFIAKECDLKVGPLTINSTYATLDTLPARVTCQRRGWNKRDIKAMLANCRSVYEKHAEPAKSDTPLPSDA